MVMQSFHRLFINSNIWRIPNGTLWDFRYTQMTGLFVVSWEEPESKPQFRQYYSIMLFCLFEVKKKIQNHDMTPI